MTDTGATLPITVGVLDKQEAALSFAAREARLAGCDIRIVHAYVVPPDPPDVVQHLYGVDVPAMFRESGREVLAGARAFLTSVAPDVTVHVDLERGSPTQVLQGHAEGSRLMVLGPDDATPWYSRLFQSRVARSMVEAAACPVVVVPDHWDAHGGPTGVTLLIDGETTARGPMRFAFEQAERHQEILHVIHLQDGDTPPATVIPWRDMCRLVDAWRARYPGVQADIRAIEGPADHTTVETLHSTGLLVLGRHHHHRKLGLLHRSLAGEVTQRASCAVAVVPADVEA